MENDQPDPIPFRAVFQHANEGILVTNPNGEIVLVNPAAEAMFGYDSGELVGQKVEILIPDDSQHMHERHRENYSQAPRARSMGLGFDLYGKRRDGSVFPVEISLSPYRSDNVDFVVVFIIDITMRQRLTRAKEEMAIELAREKETGILKSRFVSIASHEFRTPLSTILSSASLINSYADRNDLDGIRRHAGRIKNSVNLLQVILGEFLSLSRIEDGKVEVRMEEFNVCELIQEVQEDIRALLKKDQHFECVHTGQSAVRLDKNLLRAIALNLLSNAVKFSLEGALVRVECRVEDGHCDLIFKDQGIGIPPDDLPKLFGRFVRASNAGHIQGTGLGLYIVKKYAQLMGGQVSVKSTVGEGTEFCVRLPLSE